MIVLIVLIFALGLWRIRCAGRGFHPDYIARDSIQAVKGVFILLIFVSHFIQYVHLDGALDGYYLTFRSFLRQMVVVPFLFYSGYGVAVSILRRGDEYLSGIPSRRVLKVLFQFDVAVLLFVVIRGLFGTTFPIEKIFLSMIGWSSVGNSNWYIFAILILYMFSYVSFTIVRRINSKLLRETSAVAIQATLVVVLISVLRTCRPSCVYNTLAAYAFGTAFAVFAKPVIGFVTRNSGYYWMVFTAMVMMFACFRGFWGRSLVCYEMAAVSFASLIVLLSLKFVSRSPALVYCGTHLFSLYVLQRLPMVLLKGTGIAANRYAYLFVCLALTLALSHVFDRFVPLLWNSILNMGRFMKRSR